MEGTKLEAWKNIPAGRGRISRNEKFFDLGVEVPVSDGFTLQSRWTVST